MTRFRVPRSRGLAAVVAAGAVTTPLVLLDRPAPTERAVRAVPETGLLPTPVAPAFTPPKPQALAGLRDEGLWAPVRHAVVARAEPRRNAPVVAPLATSTPEGTANIVLVLGRAEDAEGRVWLHVRLAARPNNRTGWVPRAAIGGYRAVRTRLVVELGRFRATLYREGRPVFRAAIGVGKPAWPTPVGKFYVRNKVRDFGSPMYGPVAFGTSATSPVLTDWPAGGFIGIHGTDEPELLPGRVSHGCIRMRNDDILRLARLMPVGTPLTIRP
jgi:lipoprotein-anchoring transpeptidase ErfK/SrfK